MAVEENDSARAKAAAGFKFLENRSAAAANPAEGKPATHAERVEQLNRALREFYANNPLNLAGLRARLTAETIQRSTKKQKAGNYTVARDLAYSENPNGEFTAPALDSKNQVSVLKETPQAILDQRRVRHNIPAEFQDAESYLMAKKFNDPHVIMARERFNDGGNVARVFDAENMDLEAYLEDGKKLEPQIAISIIVRVADGAYALHQKGVVHTDIAPSNIILSPKDAKLGDLDGASVDPSGSGKFKRNKGERWGNRFILPPEMFKDDPEFNASVDSYQAAATVYRMVAGKWPYDVEGTTRTLPYRDRMQAYKKLHTQGKIEFPADMPPALQAVIKKAMDPHPGRRYESMRQFIVDLMGASKEVSGKEDFLQRIKSKTPALMADSLAYRERVLREGKVGSPKEKEQVEWEIEQLKAALKEQREVKKQETMVFRQKVLTTESPASLSLTEDKDAQLNPMREIREYFKRQEPEYLAQLKKLSAQINVPMDRETRAVVCIPVAGAQEASNIYKTLQSYAEQKINQASFEVLLLVNLPERFAASKEKEYKATLAEIERAKKNFPNLRVRNANVVLPDDQVRIGNIRKIGTDLALLRQQAAGLGRDLLLLSNDADNQGISTDYIKSYLDYFAEHPEKEGAVGNLQFDPNAFVRFPTVQVQQEYATYLDQTGFKHGNVDLFGANSVMKSSIYSAIGGYPTILKNGEQEWTGKTIRKLREQRGTLGFVEGAVLTTSSRRGVASYLEGRRDHAIAFGDENAEAGMRAMEIDKFPIFDYANAGAVGKLKEEMTYWVNRAISAYEKGEHLGKNSWYYRSNLEKVGIQYRVIGDPKDPNSGIEITDISKFVRRQEIMQRMIKAGEKNMAKVYEASLAA